MSKKEVAKIEEQKNVVIAEKAQALTVAQGAEEEILSSMIKLPRLSLQQKMSKAVEEEKAKVGDLFENLQNTVVCKKEEPFIFVPLKLRNVITTYEVVGQKKEFRSQVARTAKNEKQEWDEVKDGKTYKHLPETILYCINSKDLEEGNPFLPYVFTFRGASMPKGGKSIYTQKLLLDSSGIQFYKYKFKMTNEKLEKDGNTFQVANVERLNEKTDEKFHSVCEGWMQTLSNMSNIEVTEDEEINTDSKPQAATTGMEQF